LRLAIGGGFLLGATITARLLEGLFVVAILRAVIGNFCLGAYAYHVLRRRFTEAQTLPPRAEAGC
jgi:hypothetical protein